MDARHPGHKKVQTGRIWKCLMCSAIFKDKNSFKNHKAQHQKELDIITFEHICKECNLSFGSSDDQLEHLVQKHSHPTKKRNKKGSEDKEKEECKNGRGCSYLKQDRCKYAHNEEPWKTVQPRRPKQKPRHKNMSQKTKDVCRNGPSCRFLKDKKCIYSHEKKPYKS